MESAVRRGSAGLLLVPAPDYLRPDPHLDPDLDPDDEDEDFVIGIRPKSSPQPRRKTSVDEQESALQTSDVSEPPSLSGSRRVSFADAVGLSLVQIKEFGKWDVPQLPDFLEILSKEQEEYFISPFNFPSLPPSSEELLAKVQEQKVELESVELLPGTTIVKGVIRVLNISFTKTVFVRISLDNWTSHFDLLSEFMPGFSDGETDSFSFRLTMVPPFSELGARVDFCLRYETPCGTFWGNNNERNYVFFCHNRKKDVRDKGVKESVKKSCLKTVSPSFSVEESMSSPERENRAPDATVRQKVDSESKQSGDSPTSARTEEDASQVESRRNRSRRNRRKAAKASRVREHFAQQDVTAQDGEIQPPPVTPTETTQPSDTADKHCDCKENIQLGDRSDASPSNDSECKQREESDHPNEHNRDAAPTCPSEESADGEGLVTDFVFGAVVAPLYQEVSGRAGGQAQHGETHSSTKDQPQPGALRSSDRRKDEEKVKRTGQKFAEILEKSLNELGHCPETNPNESQFVDANANSHPNPTNSLKCDLLNATDMNLDVGRDTQDNQNTQPQVFIKNISHSSININKDEAELTPNIESQSCQNNLSNNSLEDLDLKDFGCKEEEKVQIHCNPVKEATSALSLCEVTLSVAKSSVQKCVENESNREEIENIPIETAKRESNSCEDIRACCDGEKVEKTGQSIQDRVRDFITAAETNTKTSQFVEHTNSESDPTNGQNCSLPNENETSLISQIQDKCLNFDIKHTSAHGAAQADITDKNKKETVLVPDNESQCNVSISSVKDNVQIENSSLSSAFVKEEHVPLHLQTSPKERSENSDRSCDVSALSVERAMEGLCGRSHTENMCLSLEASQQGLVGPVIHMAANLQHTSITNDKVYTSVSLSHESKEFKDGSTAFMSELSFPHPPHPQTLTDENEHQSLALEQISLKHTADESTKNTFIHETSLDRDSSVASAINTITTSRENKQFTQNDGSADAPCMDQAFNQQSRDLIIALEKAEEKLMLEQTSMTSQMQETDGCNENPSLLHGENSKAISTSITENEHDFASRMALPTIPSKSYKDNASLAVPVSHNEKLNCPVEVNLDCAEKMEAMSLNHAEASQLSENELLNQPSNQANPKNCLADDKSSAIMAETLSFTDENPYFLCQTFENTHRLVDQNPNANDLSVAKVIHAPNKGIMANSVCSAKVSEETEASASIKMTMDKNIRQIGTVAFNKSSEMQNVEQSETQLMGIYQEEDVKNGEILIDNDKEDVNDLILETKNEGIVENVQPESYSKVGFGIEEHKVDIENWLFESEMSGSFIDDEENEGVCERTNRKELNQCIAREIDDEIHCKTVEGVRSDLAHHKFQSNQCNSMDDVQKGGGKQSIHEEIGEEAMSVNPETHLSNCSDDSRDRSFPDHVQPSASMTDAKYEQTNDSNSDSESGSEDEMELYMHCLRAVYGQQSSPKAARPEQIHQKEFKRSPGARAKRLSTSLPSISESLDEEQQSFIQENDEDGVETNQETPLLVDSSHKEQNGRYMWWRETFSCRNILKSVLYSVLVLLFLALAYHYDFIACFGLYVISVIWLFFHGETRQTVKNNKAS